MSPFPIFTVLVLIALPACISSQTVSNLKVPEPLQLVPAHQVPPGFTALKDIPVGHTYVLEDTALPGLARMVLPTSLPPGMTLVIPNKAANYGFGVTNVQYPPAIQYLYPNAVPPHLRIIYPAPPGQVNVLKSASASLGLIPADPPSGMVATFPRIVTPGLTLVTEYLVPHVPPPLKIVPAFDRPVPGWTMIQKPQLGNMLIMEYAHRPEFKEMVPEIPPQMKFVIPDTNTGGIVVKNIRSPGGMIIADEKNIQMGYMEMIKPKFGQRLVLEDALMPGVKVVLAYPPPGKVMVMPVPNPPNVKWEIKSLDDLNPPLTSVQQQEQQSSEYPAPLRLISAHDKIPLGMRAIVNPTGQQQLVFTDGNTKTDLPAPPAGKVLIFPDPAPYGKDVVVEDPEAEAEAAAQVILSRIRKYVTFPTKTIPKLTTTSYAQKLQQLVKEARQKALSLQPPSARGTTKLTTTTKSLQQIMQDLMDKHNLKPVSTTTTKSLDQILQGLLQKYKLPTTTTSTTQKPKPIAPAKSLDQLLQEFAQNHKPAAKTTTTTQRPTTTTKSSAPAKTLDQLLQEFAQKYKPAAATTTTTTQKPTTTTTTQKPTTTTKSSAPVKSLDQLLQEFIQKYKPTTTTKSAQQIKQEVLLQRLQNPIPAVTLAPTPTTTTQKPTTAQLQFVKEIPNIAPLFALSPNDMSPQNYDTYDDDQADNNDLNVYNPESRPNTADYFFQAALSSGSSSGSNVVGTAIDNFEQGFASGQSNNVNMGFAMNLSFAY